MLLHGKLTMGKIEKSHLSLGFVLNRLSLSVTLVGWFYGASRHFQQYFSYIVSVSFIGWGIRSTRRKSPICRKSLNIFYHIMLYRAHLAWAGFELTKLVVLVTHCIGSYKFNYNTIKTTRSPCQLRSVGLGMQRDLAELQNPMVLLFILRELAKWGCECNAFH
jgi:hypothetical protein